MAICLANPDDPDHVVPAEGCHAASTPSGPSGELDDQYGEFTRRIVAVIRMEGECIEGDNGVQAAQPQIVAWWCAEEAAELVTACAASAPGTRRYFDRDVMIGLYPPPPEDQKRR